MTEIPKELLPELKQELRNLIAEDKAKIKEQEALPQGIYEKQEIDRLNGRIKLWMLIAERNGFVEPH